MDLGFMDLGKKHLDLETHGWILLFYLLTEQEVRRIYLRTSLAYGFVIVLVFLGFWCSGPFPSDVNQIRSIGKGQGEVSGIHQRHSQSLLNSQAVQTH
ncbi:hypothetical protein V5799_015714 [Amblyomma americanum]|uniref:Uncharacterized protein n=1 Tax=Amblyomma americanum TaxID=6943 RepID=A0AAQ4F707_AMBAM